MDRYEKILSLANALQPELTAIRRDLHKHAETGWLEIRTGAIVAQALTDLGWEVLTGAEVCLPQSRMGLPDQDVLDMAYARALSQGADPYWAEKMRDGATGVIGILRCGEGPTVAIRIDMDALGVFESTESCHRPRAEGFASVNEGAMHACGHDGHTTMGIGAAKVLTQIRDQLHGTVKLIFQPSEEGVRGGKAIVDKGHLDDVDYFINAHISIVDKDDPVQVIPGSYGALATKKYDVFYTGKAAHAGGAPQAGNNALLAAASAVMNLQAIPRHSQGASRINVGTLHAGSGRNVIADTAKMELEVRGDTTQICDYMADYTQRILEASAAMHGCECRIKLMGAANSMRSDEDFAVELGQVCSEKLGLRVSENPLTKSMGSEDVSYMVGRVQELGGKATVMRACTPGGGVVHSRTYDFEESVLSRFAAVFSACVLHLMDKHG